MTRAEAYAEGFQEGRRWAEADLTDGTPNARYPEVIHTSDTGTAYQFGAERGYRDTVARYEAGTLTRQMFEHAPLRAQLDALTIPENSAHSFGAPWKPSR